MLMRESLAQQKKKALDELRDLRNQYKRQYELPLREKPPAFSQQNWKNLLYSTQYISKDKNSTIDKDLFFITKESESNQSKNFQKSYLDRLQSNSATNQYLKYSRWTLGPPKLCLAKQASIEDTTPSIGPIDLEQN